MGSNSEGTMNLRMGARILAATFLLSAVAGAQVKVSEIRIKTDPENATIRPFETAVLQVLIYGEPPDLEGKPKRVRLQGSAEFQVADRGGGWLSRPFRYQGSEDEPFYGDQQEGLRRILSRTQETFVLQDAVLYTAPERPGKYQVQASREGKTATVTIRVDPGAPSYRKPEKVSFPSEPLSRDKYRKWAEHYAPFIAQETWFQPKADFLARFDYDGDWRGDNNWDALNEGASQAYVYYTVMETQTHWFLIYNLFHPRDYSDKCVAGSCHEDDNEGLILTVRQDGSAFGRLETMETLAHNNIYSYRADRRVQDGVHDIDGNVELRDQSHPVVFVEAGGHGIYGSQDSHSRYSLERDEFTASTGVTYLYTGASEKPRCADDRRVGYDLLPIYEQWWLRAQEGSGRNDRTFDEYFVYQPLGGRPGTSYEKIAGSFLGRKEASNKAKPFWGWHDERTQKQNILATGQWGLDPAYAVSRNLRFSADEPFSLEYVFNPYLQTAAPGAAPVLAPAVITEATFQEIIPRQSGNYDPNASEGQLDLRLYVDGTVEVSLQGDRIRYEVRSGRPPRDDGSELTQPIPRGTFRFFGMEQKGGREKVTLLEQPSQDNDYTVRLRIEDSRVGEGRYHARLRWKWEAMAAASANPRYPGHPPAGTELTSTDNDPSKYKQDNQGLFEFRGRVDGVVVLRIRGDRGYAEVLSGAPVQVERFSFSQPLPSVPLKEIKVEKKDGRGEVTLLDQPSIANDNTAAVQVTDLKGGAGRYHFRLTWRR